MPNPQKRIRVILGDITTLQVDAIVNSANQSLLGGAGVDRAIHRAAGRELLDECLTLDGCPVGESRLTKGYNLPAKFVIHTVGPVWMGGWNGEDEKLASAYRSALDIAEAHGFKSVAFPCISRGVHRYPAERASRIAVATIKAHSYTGTVIFCCQNNIDYDAYNKRIPTYHPVHVATINDVPSSRITRKTTFTTENLMCVPVHAKPQLASEASLDSKKLPCKHSADHSKTRSFNSRFSPLPLSYFRPKLAKKQVNYGK